MIPENIIDFCRLGRHEYGTPFYLIDLDGIKSAYLKFESIWKSFFNDCRIAYSYKSNALKAVTQQFFELGSSAEVVTGTELEWAMEDGFTGKKIFFDGPNKTIEELKQAIFKGVNIQLDSLLELETIINLFKDENHYTSFSIRLSANYHSKKSRFGFTLEEAHYAIKLLEKEKLTLSGLHFHLGSNLNDPTLYGRILDEYKDILVYVFDKNHNKVWVDIGGGFPAKSFSGTESLCPLEEFPDVIKNKLKKLIDIDQVELITEPGRCLVEDHGFLGSTICNKKKRENQEILIIDAGIHLLRSIGSWHHPFSIDSINKCNLKDLQSYRIYGSNCFESDIFTPNFKSHINIDIGDLVVFGSAGGYDICSANAWTRPFPPILGILDNELFLIKKPQENLDIRKLHLNLNETRSKSLIGI